MKKLLFAILLGCSCFTLANQPIKECIAPITEKNLTYKTMNNTDVAFAGFIIELPKPMRVGFFQEDLLLKYDNNRLISLSFFTNILTNGRSPDYDPVEVYKQAFGLKPREAKHDEEIATISRLNRLCNNELIHYKINNIDYEIIRTKNHNSFSDQTTIDTFILGDPREVYQIRFRGFSNSEIDQILATIHKPTNN